MTTSIYKIPDPPPPSQFKLLSPRGAQLATRVWSCNSNNNTKKPRALVLLVHGYGFHSGYFDELAKRLNREGLFCASFDQVCQGYSESEPGAPYGYIHVNSFDDWVADIYAALTWAQSECGGYDKDDLPVFFLGESLGGLQVLEAAMQSKAYGVQLAGLITSGAVLQVHPDLLPPAPIIKLLTWIAPCFPKLKMPNDAKLEASYDVAFGDVEWARVTRLDSKVQIAPKSTLAGAVGVLTTGPKIMARAANSSDANTTFPCPLLALHAKGDSRVDIKPMMTFVDQLGPEKAQGFWVDSTGHQLFQDQREVTLIVLDMIASWIDSQLLTMKK
jgi:alpha-beta hydrolase superfamily lysophospholipase